MQQQIPHSAYIAWVFDGSSSGVRDDSIFLQGCHYYPLESLPPYTVIPNSAPKRCR